MTPLFGRRNLIYFICPDRAGNRTFGCQVCNVIMLKLDNSFKASKLEYQLFCKTKWALHSMFGVSGELKEQIQIQWSRTSIPCDSYQNNSRAKQAFLNSVPRGYYQYLFQIDNLPTCQPLQDRVTQITQRSVKTQVNWERSIGSQPDTVGLHYFKHHGDNCSGLPQM